MDTSRLVDLYLAESYEHLRALNRALLELEDADDPASAVEEAFRAAHTIKGASSMLGLSAVAERAHELENRLERLRAGAVEADAGVVEELLAMTDALEDAVHQSAEAGIEGAAALAAITPAQADDADTTAGGGYGAARPSSRMPAAPDGTADMVRVELRAEARLKGARAMVVLRRTAAIAPVLGSSPTEAELGGEFDGVLWLFLGEAADRAAVEAEIRAAGEVERVSFGSPDDGAAAPAQTPARSAPSSSSWVTADAERPAAVRSAGRGQHVRVSRAYLDDLADGIGELAILWRRVKAALAELPGGGIGEALSSRLDRRVDDLQFTSLAVRMVPVAELFDRFPRVVRDAARALDKRVDFRIEGREIELDRALLDEISDPLVHLLRNAVAHGIERPEARRAVGKPERGRLTLRARRQRAGVLIEVTDDGAGLRRDRIVARAIDAGLVDPDSPPELTDDVALRLLSRPGLSTVDEVSDLAGRGVGLDVVVQRVRALGGAVALQSEDGRGTTFTLRLPLTFVVADALHVRVADEDYMIPVTHVQEAVELEHVEIARVRGEEVLRLRDELVPLVRLRAALGAGGDAAGSAVVAELPPRRAALAVDAIVSRERIVVKDFDAPRETAPYFSGATLLADGRPALVLDPTSVL